MITHTVNVWSVLLETCSIEISYFIHVANKHIKPLCLHIEQLLQEM